MNTLKTLFMVFVIVGLVIGVIGCAVWLRNIQDVYTTEYVTVPTTTNNSKRYSTVYIDDINSANSQNYCANFEIAKTLQKNQVYKIEVRRRSGRYPRILSAVPVNKQ